MLEVSQIEHKQKECCIFKYPSPKGAWESLRFEVIERFKGSSKSPNWYRDQDLDRKNIIRLDDGCCSFIRCKMCGALFVYYFNETLVYYGADGDIYLTCRGLYSVANRNEAVQLSSNYNGSAITNDLGRLKIVQRSGLWEWNKSQ